jgi:hypothetical protein
MPGLVDSGFLGWLNLPIAERLAFHLPLALAVLGGCTVALGAAGWVGRWWPSAVRQQYAALAVAAVALLVQLASWRLIGWGMGRARQRTAYRNEMTRDDESEREPTATAYRSTICQREERHREPWAEPPRFRGRQRRSVRPQPSDPGRQRHLVVSVAVAGLGIGLIVHALVTVAPVFCAQWAERRAQEVLSRTDC